MTKNSDSAPHRPVIAPPPHGRLPSAASSVLAVTLEDDEEVEWIWIYGPEESYVSGYRIVKMGVEVAGERD